MVKNRASTSEASDDPALRGRTYAIPFVQVWRAANTLTSRPRWTVRRSDEDDGIIEATTTPRIFRFEDDVVVEISLDANAQTRVEMASTSEAGRLDMGRHRRRIRRFMADLDQAVGATPDKILAPAGTPAP